MTKGLPIHRITLPLPWSQPGPVHVYLVRADPVTLIDTGLNDAPSREALLDGLKVAGVDIREIRRLLITHAHVDHFGQAAWIQEMSGAEVFMHPDEEGKSQMPDWWIEGREQMMVEAGAPPEARRLIHQTMDMGRRFTLPLSAYSPVVDGQRFAFDRGELTALHLPGHALGHTAYWENETGTLVGGDHLLANITPNPILEPLPDGHPAAAIHAPHRALTLGQFLNALRRVMDLPVRQVFPAHGPVITDHAAVVRSYVSRHQRRLDSFWQRIQQGVTAYTVTRELYPRVREWDTFLAISEVMAHLDLLVEWGRAAIEPDDSGLIYRSV